MKKEFLETEMFFLGDKDKPFKKNFKDSTSTLKTGDHADGK